MHSGIRRHENPVPRRSGPSGVDGNWGTEKRLESEPAQLADPIATIERGVRNVSAHVTDGDRRLAALLAVLHS